MVPPRRAQDAEPSWMDTNGTKLVFCKGENNEATNQNGFKKIQLQTKFGFDLLGGTHQLPFFEMAFVGFSFTFAKCFFHLFQS